MKAFPLIAVLCVVCTLFSCSGEEEMSFEELEAVTPAGLEEILAKTQNKPWRGEDFAPGRLGGTWYSVMNEDPKSFNLLVAESDSSTSAVVSSMHDYLFDYDLVRREWKPRVASFEVIADEAADTLTVRCTLRDDLYWSYYNSDSKIKVTSDDVVFWYNEISGDETMGSSAYYQQFLTMSGGGEGHVEIAKIDERRFEFRFPRIVADPLLATNMDFGPRHIYEPAKRADGAQGVRDVFSVASDPREIPSMGEWFLVEYTSGQRLVYKRNPDYWRKDTNGLSVPYIEEQIVRIIPDENTQFLLFKEGQTETYRLRPEDLDDLVIRGQEGYTVFNAEGSLSAAYWTFNQNVKNREKPQYEWFTQKEFRQAMSCLLNRERIIAQVYRGLAEPKLSVFPEPNPYYNPDIEFQYLYDRQRAEDLLASIGIKRDRRGIMRDAKDRAIEFDLSIRSESTINNDIASIIRDELSKMGIKVNIRILDFQKLVEILMQTFEWDSMIMGLSGTNIFPSQGSNVWPSSGNLHMWYPNQKQPATEWEARLDYLYNEGCYTIDREKAQAIWDEFQQIILEQCPLISLLRSRSFWAIRDRWDFSNVYYDNLNGAETTHIFIKQ
ncbi:MAG: ABC transporter substrate-binding protein [Treponema sp.]|jgi:peptide/nickel transport system substrate-binding protein|nr:ABC transporter substrate-binding protein [Treponema sp.]